MKIKDCASPINRTTKVVTQAYSPRIVNQFLNLFGVRRAGVHWSSRVIDLSLAFPFTFFSLAFGLSLRTCATIIPTTRVWFATRGVYSFLMRRSSVFHGPCYNEYVEQQKSLTRSHHPLIFFFFLVLYILCFKLGKVQLLHLYISLKRNV